MELMYRQIFEPEIENINITVPKAWKGMNIEVIVFPIKNTAKRVSETKKKRNELLDRYLIDLSDFKFNRDEANEYE